MPEGDVIASAAIELTADARGVMDAIQQTFKEVEDAGAEFAARFGDQMAQALSGMADTEFGQLIAEQAAVAGVSVEAFVEGLATLSIELGRTKEEAVVAGEAYKTELGEKLVVAVQSAVFEVQNLGAVTPETAREVLALAAAATAAANGSDKLTATLQQLGPSIQGVGQQAKTMGGAAGTAATGVGNLGGAASDADIAMAGANKVLGMVGLSVGSLASGLAVVTVAWKAVQEVMKEIEASAALGMTLADANFRMEVSARAAQRAIGAQALSIKEAETFAADLSKTYGQSVVVTTNLTGKAIQMTREMGWTGEQVKDLTKAAVVLNETIGMDSMSALMMISRYISSGYGMALAKQGFAVSRAAQQQEAYALGIMKPLKAMTEQEKQMVRTSLIMRQVNVYAEDAAAGQENLGKMAAHANQELEEQRKKLGMVTGFFKTLTDVIGKDFQAKFIQVFAGLGGWFALFFSDFLARLLTLKEALDDFSRGGIKGIQSLEYYSKRLDERFWATMERIKKGVFTLGNAFGEAGQAASDFEAQVAEAMGGVSEEIDDAIQKSLESIKKLEQDTTDAIAKLWDDYYKDQEKNQLEFDRDIRAIDEQAAEDQKDATEGYQKDELRAAEDHKRAMRDLEVQYLFDLQDAVRERDARQVLLLQRRYNMEKSKAEADNRVNSDRRRQDFQQELVDIAKHAAEKKAKRLRDFKEEMADLEYQAILRRKKLEADRDKEIQRIRDEAVALGVDIINRLIAAGVDPKVVEEVAKRLGVQFGGTMGAETAKQFTKIVGPFIQAYMTAAAKAMGAFYGNKPGAYTGSEPKRVYSTSSYSGSEPKTGGYYGKGFAVGGDFIATAPQMIQVGERPERVSIQPLNRATGDAAGTMGGAGRRGGGGKVEVAIALSEGLEGNIVDQAMAEVADVFVTLNRGDAARGAGGRR